MLLALLDGPCTCGLYTGTHCGSRKGQLGPYGEAAGPVLTGNCFPDGYYHCKDAKAPADLKSICTGPLGCHAKPNLGDDVCGTAF